MVVRYEDLRTSPLPILMQMVHYLLPRSLHPTLSSLVCALVLDPSREAYKSRKSPPLSSWHKWDPDARRMVLETTKLGWCRFGYDAEFRKTLRHIEQPIDCRTVLQNALLASSPAHVFQ